MNPQQLWKAVLGELELLLSKANFTTWFNKTGISSFEEERVVISVPNGFTKEWLEKKYHQTILKALRSVTNNKVKEIVYKIEAVSQQLSANLVELTPTLDQTSEQIEAKYKNTELKEKKQQDSFNLNPKYIFANFIVGKNNELAHAAALAVSKNPGKTYNPLFIYGGVGLGKTHLLQAIGQKVMIDNLNSKILYVSCEKFANDFIKSISTNRAERFKEIYRSVDVLLIDDVQFLSGKEGTQEAFFHTFNDLHQANKQVVMTSDRPPKSIPGVENRLVSRFEWGMIADISTPDLETRAAILRAKCREKNYPLDHEIITYLAANIQNNIQQLASVQGVDINENRGMLTVNNNNGRLNYSGGNLNLNGNLIINVKGLVSQNNKWYLDTDGNLIQRIVTGKGTRETYSLQSGEKREVILSGSSQLQNGQKKIELNELDQEIVDKNTPFKINITMADESNGVYISERDYKSFVVKENGTSKVSIAFP